jgi:hypothetical protein
MAPKQGSGRSMIEADPHTAGSWGDHRRRHCARDVSGRCVGEILQRAHDPWQIWVLRSLLIVPILTVLAWKTMLPAGAGWVMLRSLIIAAMDLAMYAGIPRSTIAAALYTGPRA